MALRSSGTDAQFLRNMHNGALHRTLGAAAQGSDFRKTQPVQGIEQEPAALGLGAGVQDGHQLPQRFHAAKVVLRRFAVDTHALGGNYVLVKLPAIPVPPLLMEQVLGLVVGPVKKFIDFQRDLHGHSLSVVMDGYSGRAKLTFKCREFAATPSRKR